MSITTYYFILSFSEVLHQKAIKFSDGFLTFASYSYTVNKSTFQNNTLSDSKGRYSVGVSCQNEPYRHWVHQEQHSRIIINDIMTEAHLLYRMSRDIYHTPFVLINRRTAVNGNKIPHTKP
jgi:hypothetical protein